MKFLLTCILPLLLVRFAPAQDGLPDKPKAWVTDYTGVLTATETGALNSLLSGLEQRSSNQIFIALFDRIPEGYYLEDYAVRLYEKWRPGLPDKDNGILMVIIIQDRQIRIEVGYGLEDVVTDAQAGRLIRDYMAPSFKQGNYYAGLRAVLDVLIPAVEGKYQLPRPSEKNRDGFSIPVILIFFLIVWLLSRLSRGKHSTGYGTRPRSTGGWFLPGAGFGGFSGGGRSGGGFSGGFGGLSGGGGASGSW